MEAPKPPKGAIYTRNGDEGYTKLYDMSLHRKDDDIIVALGSVDMLNAQIGMVIAHINDYQSRPGTIDVIHEFGDITKTAQRLCTERTELREIVKLLSSIQHDLLDIGSSVGTPRITTKNQRKLERTSFPDKTKSIEEQIDAYTAKMPELRKFILPQGTLVSASLHVARASCRASESSLVRAGDIETSVMSYINRLSDLLFTLARYTNHIASVGDKVRLKRKRTKSEHGSSDTATEIQSDIP
jgi:cob(I)alamin adenosyltransferase